jgi:hypothetical protein
VTITGQSSVGLTSDYQTYNCATTPPYVPGYGANGDGVYQVTVPAGKTLTVTLTPGKKTGDTISWDPLLALVTDCNVATRPTEGTQPKSCHSYSDGVGGAVEVLSYTNSGAAPVTMYVIVDACTTCGTGSYSIRADLL